METLTKTQEILNAVNQATDTLLMDMPYDEAAAEALQRIGFHSSENVRDWHDHRDNHERAVYYLYRYPQYKFITEHQLGKIRRKYNLVTGAFSIYKGAVPTKNLQEMMNFTVNGEDLPVRHSMDPEQSDFSDSVALLQKSIAASFGIPAHLIGGPVVLSGRGLWRNFLNRASQSEQDFSRRSQEDYEKETLMRAANEPRKPVVKLLSFVALTRDYPEHIRITAPAELFAAPDPGLDPIVTVAVQGGYLIVTAWGPEASDPDVVNAHMN